MQDKKRNKNSHAVVIIGILKFSGASVWPPISSPIPTTLLAPEYCEDPLGKPPPLQVHRINENAVKRGALPAARRACAAAGSWAGPEACRTGRSSWPPPRPPAPVPCRAAPGPGEAKYSRPEGGGDWLGRTGRRD